MKKIIIGLVGQLASGKGTIKKYLVEKYQAEDCRFSTSMRDVLNRLGIETSRINLQKLSTILRQNFGEDLFAKIIANDAKNFKSNLVVVDGVRRLADVKYLRDLEGFVLVAVDADVKKRYERMVLRNENEGDNQKAFESFLIDHQAEAELDIPAVMKTANYFIDNNGTLEDLYKQVDELIKKNLL